MLALTTSIRFLYNWGNAIFKAILGQFVIKSYFTEAQKLERGKLRGFRLWNELSRNRHVLFEDWFITIQHIAQFQDTILYQDASNQP